MNSENHIDLSVFNNKSEIETVINNIKKVIDSKIPSLYLYSDIQYHCIKILNTKYDDFLKSDIYEQMISTLQKVPTQMKKLLESKAAVKLLGMFLLYQSQLGQYNLEFLLKFKELKSKNYTDYKEFNKIINEFIEKYMDSSSQTVASAAADQIYDIEVHIEQLQNNRSKSNLDDYINQVYEYFNTAIEQVEAWLENISLPFSYTIFYALYSAALSLNNSICIIILFRC